MSEVEASRRLGVAKQRIVAELGDLAWYVARMQAMRGAIIESHVCWDVSADGLLRFLEWSAGIDEWGAARSADLLAHFVRFVGADLEAVLDANVAKLTARKAAGTLQGSGDR